MAYKNPRQRDAAAIARLDEKGICSGLFDCDCACAAAPDYSGLANASKDAALIGKQLGDEQLAESKRQYDNNMAVAKPVIDAQLALMNQTKKQGDEYYNYMVAKQRPVEDALNAEAMTGKVDAATQQAMDEAANTALADSRVGTTQQMNQLIRQGLRYGWSPAKLAAMGGATANANASSQVAAANGARTNARTQNWARRLDVAGLYRNLPGASQGAYGLANASGNGAVGNATSVSGQLLNGMAAGAGTTMTGQGQRISGLGSVLGAQTSYANSVNQSMNSGGGGLGGILGLGASLLSAPGSSVAGQLVQAALR